MRKISAILTAVVFLLGCTSQEVSTQLNTAEQIMNNRPDSALVILQSIDRSSVVGRRDNALYSLLYSQALDKNYVDIASDTLIMPAVRYYAKHIDSHYTAMAYFYYARVCENTGNIESAIKAFVDAKRYVTDENPYMQGLIHSCLGSLYLDQDSFEEAVDAYTVAIEAFAAANSEQNQQVSLAARARANSMLGNYDDAITDYHDALSLATTAHDTIRICHRASDIAMVILFKQNNARLALSTLTHYLQQYNNGQPTIDMYPLLCAIHYEMGNMLQARYYGRLALEHSDCYELSQLPGIYILMSKIEANANNYSKALEYRTESEEVQAIVESTNRETLIQKTEQRYNYQLAQEQLAIQEYRNRYLTSIYVSIIAAILILFTIIFLLIRKRHRAKELLYNESIDFTEALRSELSAIKSSNAELADKLNASNEKANNLRRAFDNKIESLDKFLNLASYCESDHALFVKRFKNFIKINSKNNNQFFCDLIDVVNMNYSGILDYLKEQYPALTDEDIYLCGLICLGFSSQSIGIIFGNVSVKSIYNRRYRLRRNLNMEPSDNEHIGTFITSTLNSLSIK